MSRRPPRTGSARRRRRTRPAPRSTVRPIAVIGGFFSGLFRLAAFVLLGALLVGSVALGVYMTELDQVIQAKFAGKRWALPARVYARPLQLFPGFELNADQFAAELDLLPYHISDPPNRPGTFVRRDDTFDIYTRNFKFWDGTEPARQVRLSFKDDKLASVDSLDQQTAPALMRMEPAEIAGIYPAHGEDRVLVRYSDIPPVLIDTLIAVEDRSFFNHFGVDPRGLIRALIANIRAGRTVQGGSTLTQQLVKNFFLSNERTLKRKFNEMLMALLVEWHYSKEAIIEAYSNEIYLGQDGSRAVHGFGLAARFYFDRTLAELDLHHIAFLVGVIQGPSRYNPRRYPEVAKQRRALVLDVMVEQSLISSDDAVIAKAMPLDVTPRVPRARGRFPAFLDLVRRQLRDNYHEQDLTSEGLKVFTTLDPLVQLETEQALLGKLPALEKKAKLADGSLQTAAIVADTQTGEVQAVVGGRDVRLEGFNRALDAQRPAGSLLKPAVYLTALEFPLYYTLATLLNDKELVYSPRGGKTWNPKNYDKRYHGWVTLIDALARSYNVATARLGLEVDLLRIIETLQRLGLQRELKPYPSLLLGAVDMSPFEIAQLYATFASGGYRLPLRSITEVTAASGQPLPRLYSLSLEKVIEPGPAFLIVKALQRVAAAGTARKINKVWPKLGIAGKTGTTDELRDSWFSGFSGNLLTVVWLGRDNNEPARLSGAQGALPLWIEVMKRLPLVPLEPVQPADIEYALIDPRNGYLARRRCKGARSMPFIAGSAPTTWSSCGFKQQFSEQDEQESSEPVSQSEPVTTEREQRPYNVRSFNRRDSFDAGGREREESESLGSFFKRLLR